MKYLDDQENLANLEGQLGGEERRSLKLMQATRMEAAFLNRLFIVYRVRSDRSPSVLTTLKMTDFWMTSNEGGRAVMEDLDTGEELEIGHIPTRLFDFDIFVQVPPIAKIRWDARLDDDSIVRRSLVYPLLIRTLSRSDRFEAGHDYIETPKRFVERFPNHELPLRHI